MTTKERLHRLVDELTEQDAAEMLRLISSQRDDVDEWGSLSKWSEVLFKDTMRRLAEEERAPALPKSGTSECRKAVLKGAEMR